MVWVRLAIAAVVLAVVALLIARTNRRLRNATVDGSVLRRRVAEPGAAYGRFASRLEPLGFRMLGDHELVDRRGRRLHRMVIAWHDGDATLALRGRRVFSFFTELGGVHEPGSSVVVQTSTLDVDRTHPRYVIQTVRGVKHGTEAALLRIHHEAIQLLAMEGWEEIRRDGDPTRFAHRVLTDEAAAWTVGERRRSVELGSAAHRTYANGRAQVGTAVVGAR